MVKIVIYYHFSAEMNFFNVNKSCLLILYCTFADFM